MTLVRAASALYAAALVVCPRALRDRHAGDMRATFDALANASAARGALAVVALTARELADLVVARVSTSTSGRGQSPLSNSVWGQAPFFGRRSMGSVWQDVRYAWRMLRRQPAFAGIAILTLALGIGATTAVFTVVNGVLLRPLPYADPDRLVVLLNGQAGRVSSYFSPPNFSDITTESGVFESSAAINPSLTVNLTGRGEPERLDGAEVTWTFFHVLGVRARAGRLFGESDARNSEVIVVSDGFWRRRLGAQADVVGATLTFDGTPHTVIGVAPPDLRLPAGVDFWRPLVFQPNQITPQARGANWVSAVARLKPGVDLDRANAAMATVAGRLAAAYPRTNQGRQMSAIPMHERMVRNIRPALLVLLGAVSLVLLIACVNVANLLLARAQARTREVAVRAALGAGRGRLVRQFLAESLLLGVLGGAGGLAVAYGSVRALVALGPESIPRLADITIDWRVLAFASATAIGTSLLFGLAPALTGAAGRLVPTATRGSIGAAGTRTRKALVVCEMALAVILLAGAALLIRSYARITRVDPGFSAERILTFTIALPESKYPTVEAVSRFVASYVDRLGRRPGVEHASAVFGIPLANDFSASSSFTRQGEADSADSPGAGFRVVTPDYFQTMKIPLRAGRLLDARDDAVGPEVVLINETAARRYWPNGSPIGQTIHLGIRLAPGVRSGQKTIVGIVGDVKYGGLDATAPAEVYLPYAQHPVDAMTIAVRTAADPMAFVADARAALAALDRELPIASVQTMNEIVGQSVAERRFTMLLLATFAVVAVALAAIGVYGVLAFVVTQRTAEIGLRLAVGASPADVVRLFVREGAMLMAAGLACGLAGALGASRYLATLLFGVTPTDPATFAAVALALAVVAFTASYVPARRAARVDPMEALRTD